MSEAFLQTLSLAELTGLESSELAQTLLRNPRSYMNVRGAVAETHLKRRLSKLKKNDKIEDFEDATGDSEKDFTVEINNDDHKVIECKNAEVIRLNMHERQKYLSFLAKKDYLSECRLIELFERNKEDNLLYSGAETQRPETLSEVENAFGNYKNELSKRMLSHVPQSFRESSYPRYQFSASLVEHENVDELGISDYISQFDPPITVDFQRTRNSKSDSDGRKDEPYTKQYLRSIFEKKCKKWKEENNDDPMCSDLKNIFEKSRQDAREKSKSNAKRYYRKGEVDMVAVCLFSRTLEWEFLFGNELPDHKFYEDRFTSALTVKGTGWYKSLVECAKDI